MALDSCQNFISIVCAGAILKNRPVCYGTSQLKTRVCAVVYQARHHSSLKGFLLKCHAENAFINVLVHTI